MNLVFFLMFGYVSAWFGGEVNYTPHSQEHDVKEEDLLNITEVKGFPDPKTFIYSNIDIRHPLVMREAMTDSAVYRLWSDDTYFTTTASASDAEKTDTEYFKPDGYWDYFSHDMYIGDEKFSNFVENYKQKDQTIASFVPNYLLKDIIVPCAIQCVEFMDDTLYRPIIWMSNSKLATRVHTDVGDNIICSLRGRLNFTLFENKDRKKLRLVKGYNTISDIKSPFHDFGSDVQTRKINISRGDCFYIPLNTTYNVQSNDNVVAISIMWKQICHHLIKMDKCNTNCQTNATMGDVTFHKYDETIKKVKAIQRLVISKYDDYEGMIKNTANFNLEKEKDGEIILSFAEIIFSILDRDGDKTVSDKEFDNTSLQDWLKYGEKNNELNLLLKHYNTVHEPPPIRRRIEL